MSEQRPVDRTDRQERQSAGRRRWTGRAFRVVILTVMLVAVAVVAVVVWPDWFDSDAPAIAVAGGDPELGRDALRSYGCISCHSVPGVRGPDTYVGPPLDAWAQRSYIAGSLENNPDNLIYWIQFPDAVEPGTAMPTLGVSEEDARDIAAYLYTLRD